MNITGYNLETLREKIRNLQEENNKFLLNYICLFDYLFISS